MAGMVGTCSLPGMSAWNVTAGHGGSSVPPQSLPAGLAQVGFSEGPYRAQCKLQQGQHTAHWEINGQKIVTSKIKKGKVFGG